MHAGFPMYNMNTGQHIKTRDSMHQHHIDLLLIVELNCIKLDFLKTLKMLGVVTFCSLNVTTVAMYN